MREGLHQFLVRHFHCWVCLHHVFASIGLGQEFVIIDGNKIGPQARQQFSRHNSSFLFGKSKCGGQDFG